MVLTVSILVVIAVFNTLKCPLSKVKQVPKIQILIIITCILVVLATFRNPDMPDYDNYKTAFIFGALKFERLEPTYLLLTDWLVKYKIFYLWGFFIYAIIGISIKIYDIQKLAPFIWGSILVYLCNFYILHDLIQIRVSIATGLLLFSLKYKLYNNYIKFIVCVLLASLFHISALIMLPFAIVSSQKSFKWMYLSLIPVSYLFYFSHFTFGHILGILKISHIEILFDSYSSQEEEINVLNVIQLMRIMVISWICFRLNHIYKHYPLSVILYKIYVIGIISLVLFSDIITLSTRISELLLTSEILLIPSLIFSLKPKYQIITKGIIIGYSLSIFFIYVFYTEILF